MQIKVIEKNLLSSICSIIYFVYAITNKLVISFLSTHASLFFYVLSLFDVSRCLPTSNLEIAPLTCDIPWPKSQDALSDRTALCLSAVDQLHFRLITKSGDC